MVDPPQAPLIQSINLSDILLGHANDKCKNKATHKQTFHEHLNTRLEITEEMAHWPVTED